MAASHRRHDIADRVWKILQPLCPGGKGKMGRPPDYGHWNNTHRRYCRWRDRGLWDQLLDAVIDDPDLSG